MSRPDIIAANRLRGSSMPRSSDIVSRSAFVRSSARRSAIAPSCCATRGQRLGGARRGRSPGGCLAMSGGPPGPASIPIHRILHTGVRPCPPSGGCTCAASPASRPVPCGRPPPAESFGEPGDPGGTVDPVIGPVYGDERLAEIAQGGFGRWVRRAVRSLRPAPALPSLQPAEGMDAEGVAADATFRLLPHLDLGDEVAGCRIRPGELDAGCLTDQTASSVAPDEIFCPQRLAIAQLDVYAGVVLRETVTSRPR